MTNQPTQNTETPSTGRADKRGREETVHLDENFSLDTDRLEIPEALRKRYAAKGLELRWIRYRQGEKEDYSNISRKMRVGWKFVSPDDVPEIAHATQVMNFGRYNGLVTIEDVALAVNTKANIKRLRELKAEKARRQMAAEDEKLARFKDIRKNSKTSVTTGKRVSFEDADTE